MASSFNLSGVCYSDTLLLEKIEALFWGSFQKNKNLSDVFSLEFERFFK